MEIDWNDILDRCVIGDRELTESEVVMFRLLGEHDNLESADIIEAVNSSHVPITPRAVRMMIKRWLDRGYLVRVGNSRRIRVARAVNRSEAIQSNGHCSDPIYERFAQLVVSIDKLTAALSGSMGVTPIYRDIQADRILHILNTYRQADNGNKPVWVSASELRKAADLHGRSSRVWNDLIRAYGRIGMLEVNETNGLKVRLVGPS